MKSKAVLMATGLCAALVVLAALCEDSAGGPMPLTPGKGQYCSNCHKGSGLKMAVDITSETVTQISYSVSGSTNVYSGGTGWGVFNSAGANIAHGYGSGQFTLLRDGQTYRVFWVNDGNGRGGSANQYITVNDVNRAPELSPIGDKVVDENQSLSFTVSASDPDGTTPSVTASNLPQGASFADKGHGTGLFSWTPTHEQAGLYPSVRFEASDGELAVSEEIAITVLPRLEVTELLSDEAGNVTLRWQSVPGRTYTVQYADWGGGTLEWQTADANCPGSHGDQTMWTDDGTNTPSPPSTAWGRFYRIQMNQ